MKKVVLAAISAASLLISASTFAGDAAKGKTVYNTKACMGCHGPDGKSMVPTYPKLAGQHAQYIVKQLKEFKAGKRSDPTMAAMAAPLTDADMDNVAAYLASVK